MDPRAASREELVRRIDEGAFAPPRHAMFLCSQGRSGATWVVEVLGEACDGRVLFEPCVTPLARAIAGDSLRPQLAADGQAGELERYYARLLSGRIHDPWIDKAGFRPWSDTLILKLIRANLMLPWLAARFPAVPIVLLFRHPVPVARSAVAQGWDSPLEHVLATPGLPPDLVAAGRPALVHAPGSYEQWVAHWALESALMLRAAQGLGAPLYFYEELRRDPAGQFPRLARSGGLELAHFRADQVGKPSCTAADQTWKAPEQVDAWLAEASAEELAWAAQMLAAFALEDLYDARAAMPRRAAA